MFDSRLDMIENKNKKPLKSAEKIVVPENNIFTKQVTSETNFEDNFSDISNS